MEIQRICLLLMVCLSTSCCTKPVYSLVESEKYGTGIAVYYRGKKLAEIKPEYMGLNPEKMPFQFEQSVLLSIYDSLCERGSLPHQPKPFDDINGDGKPDFVCIERSQSLSNHPPWAGVIRIFSLNKNNQPTELKPIYLQYGEALHFDDFNKDGVLELVNTDNERSFKYHNQGLPLSSEVWVYAEATGSFKRGDDNAGK